MVAEIVRQFIVNAIFVSVFDHIFGAFKPFHGGWLGVAYLFEQVILKKHTPLLAL